MIKRILIVSIITFSFLSAQNCEPGYSEINNFCFHQGDLDVLQKFIDNSYATGFTEENCYEGDPYCGSPNPYMDAEDGWFWVVVDSIYYDTEFQNANGIVEPLELGLQEWNEGRLTSLMCGAYIYCQLSGPIPEEIETLSEINVLRLEMNYLSGFVPEAVCDLLIDTDDYLEFDLGGNHLCPPYPDCVGEGDFWYQDTSSCTEVGDNNFDNVINVQDIIIIITFIIGEQTPNNQEFIASDYNFDGMLDVLDVVSILDFILS